MTRIRTWVVAATTQSTNHYTITADAETRSKGRSKHKSHFFLLKIGKKSLPGGESNPGLPRDRRRYSPLYYRGWGTFWEQNSLLDSLLLPTTISRWIYRFSSDHRSQAASGPVSTWMGDGNKFWFIYYITSIALSEFSPIRGTIDCSRINCPVVLNYAWHIDISDGNWFESYPRGETVQLIQFVYYVHLLHRVIFVLSEGQYVRHSLAQQGN